LKTCIAFGFDGGAVEAFARQRDESEQSEGRKVPRGSEVRK